MEQRAAAEKQSRIEHGQKGKRPFHRRAIKQDELNIM